MAWGDETIAVLEIDQPLCSLTYGVSPCTAALGVTGTKKCFNSRFTTQDTVNYTPGTLTLRFVRDQLDVQQYGNVIPSLRSFRTTPMSINLGGMEESVSAFGKRETVTIVLDDHRYDDHLVDKYRLERRTGDASLLDSGTAQAGTADTITLEAGAPESFAGTPIVRLVTGPGSVQERPLLSFDGTTKVATVSPRWRSNLFTNSEAITLSFNPQAVAVSANAELAPDGTMTAERLEIVGNSSFNLGGAAPTGLTGETFAFSIHMNGLSGDEVAFSIYFGNSTSQFGSSSVFSIAGGVISKVSGNAEVEAIGGGWYRIHQVQTLTGDCSNLNLTFGSIAIPIALWGRQLEKMDALGDYIKTGAAAITFPDAIEDDFERADNADVGAAWTPTSTFTAGEIVGGAVRGTGTGSAEYRNDIAWRDDQWSEITIKTVNTGAGQAGPAAAVRMDRTTRDLYVAMCQTSGIILVQWGPAAFNVIGNGAAAVAGDRVRLEAIGDQISVYVNDVLRIGPITDTVRASGDAGWYCNSGTGSQADAEIEAWSSGTGYEIRDAFDPYKRGSFWGKWLARNPYHSGYPARLKLGTVGQALTDMRVRHYVVDRIEGPANGQVRVILKDLFSLVEAKKAVAPFASLGELSANLTGSPPTFGVLPSGIGNLTEAEGGYASITAVVSGHVAIGDEIIEVTRSGDTFTVVTRGALNTTAEDHDAEDLVQIVLSEVAQLGHDIIYRLLTVHGGIPAAQINKTLWDQRAQGLTEIYTGRVTTPTPVNKLVGEMMLEAGCTVWPDTATGMIEFVALQAGAVSHRVTDAAWIAEGGSLSIKRQDDKRITQVHVYYGQINPSKDLDDKRNFRSRSVTVDLAAEGDQQYGTPVIREIPSRWIPQFGRQSAERVGERLIAMFRDAPHEATIPLHASRDGELNLARYFSLETAEIQDALGAVRAVTMAPVEIDRGETATEVRAQQVSFGAQEIAGERVIYIENDSVNLNVREIHDSLYAAPTGSEVVRCVVLADVGVGSTHVDLAALRTGIWPEGVTLTLQFFGFVIGKGGRGGAGQRASLNGAPGNYGGIALLLEFPTIFDNQGAIWAGAGGGGAGAGVTVLGQVVPGGGGGGGGGFNPGEGGIVDGEFSENGQDAGGSDPDSFTLEAGDGGLGWHHSDPSYHAGNGGRGGDVFTGLDGANGTTAESPFGDGPGFEGDVGQGGDPGFAVVGSAFITEVVNNGEIIGQLG